MYVTPRPDARDDPHYAVRLGLTGALSYLAVAILNPALPPVVAALLVGLIAAQRRAFNWGRATGAPMAMTVMVTVFTRAVEQLRPMPLVYVGAMWLTYFGGFLVILRTGAPMGMLILIVAVLMSVMGMNGLATVETMRDGFVQASLVALVLAPLVYRLALPRTREAHVDDPVPGPGHAATGAVIRASVMMALTFWLYTVMQPADMMMAMVATMVLVFPTRKAVTSEAMQRVCATLYGGAAALALLALWMLWPHLPILLGLIFLAGLGFGHLMLVGRQPSMVYQYAFSVVLALVAGALSTQDPGYATFTRIVLTVAGAFAAAFTVGLLVALTDWRGERAAPA